MSKDLNKVSFSEVVVESRQSFKPDANHFGGLCVGSITKVTLDEVEIPAMTDGVPSSWDMAGKKSYNLTIEFKQTNVDPKDTSERFVTLRESIISTKKSTGEAIDLKTWNGLVVEQYRRLQHIVNTLNKANLAPIGAAPKAECEPNYADSVEVRIAKAEKLFKHYLKAIVGKEEAPRYTNVPLWLRVVTKVPEGSYYVIPAFVGKGFMEVVTANVPPVIELAPNDSIVLIKKQPKNGNAKPDMNAVDNDAVAAKPDATKSAADVLAGLGINVAK